MTSKFEKVLNENLGLPEEAKGVILEAWNEQLSEAKQQAVAELREEFAQKFEYDKSVIVESMNKFMTDKIRTELEEFAQDKQALVAERVQYKQNIKSHSKMLNDFITEQLAQEVKELREDRRKATEGVTKLEQFMLQQLAEEIKEFHQDKKALVEQKVKMVKEGKEVLVKTKQKFIKEAAQAVERNIESVLRHEIQQYRDDIIAARNNDFGRRIFEAFAGEYMTSYLTEGSEVKKMQSLVNSMKKQVSVLEAKAAEKDALLESAKRKVDAANDRIQREKVLSSLLAPLGKGKKEIMKDLLESVKTANLKEAFNKYLPAVLNETVVSKNKTVLREGAVVEKTGDRAQTVVAQDNSTAEELNDIIRLAGINKL